jgi:hypothetical protein
LRQATQIDTVAVRFAPPVSVYSNHPPRFISANTRVPLGPRGWSPLRPRTTTGIRKGYRAAWG